MPFPSPGKCAPKEYDSHCADQRAGDDYRDRSVDVGELQVVGVNASSLKGEIHEDREGVVQHMG